MRWEIGRSFMNTQNKPGARTKKEPTPWALLRQEILDHPLIQALPKHLQTHVQSKTRRRSFSQLTRIAQGLSRRTKRN